MRWTKEHAVALLIGAAVGYYVAKKGGLKAAVSAPVAAVKGTV